MSKNEVIVHMKKTLDSTARLYEMFNDEPERQKKIKKDFRTEAMAFNTLLTDMYKRIKFNDKFVCSIESYIIERQLDNWK